jgi:hypothetical protein
MSGTLSDTMENKYDAIPYNIKEHAGFPARYINLTSDQREMIMALLEDEYKTKKELDIEEQLEYIVDISGEVSSIANALMHRYGVARR